MKTFFAGRLLIILMATVAVAYQAAAEPTGGSSGTIEWSRVTQTELPEKPLDIVHSLDGKYAFILTTGGNILVYDRSGKITGTIAAGKGVKAIDIDPRGQYLYLADADNKQFKTLTVDFTAKLDTRHSPYKGNIDAPVTVAVFSDFQ